MQIKWLLTLLEILLTDLFARYSVKQSSRFSIFAICFIGFLLFKMKDTSIITILTDLTVKGINKRHDISLKRIFNHDRILNHRRVPLHSSYFHKITLPVILEYTRHLAHRHLYSYSRFCPFQCWVILNYLWQDAWDEFKTRTSSSLWMFGSRHIEFEPTRMIVSLFRRYFYAQNNHANCTSVILYVGTLNVLVAAPLFLEQWVNPCSNEQILNSHQEQNILNLNLTFNAFAILKIFLL